MNKIIEKKAPNIEEAFRLAERELEQMGVEYEVISKEVMEKGKSGFFGIGAVPARVRITYEEVVKEAPAAVEEPAAAPVQEKAETAAETKSEPVVFEVPAGSSAEQAKTFIDGLLAKLGIQGEAFPSVTEEGNLLIDIRGEDMGAVIGRRGDTLDAIQYLTSLSINRGREEHIRVTLDTEGYRAKREESLQRLARKMAGKVLKYHKNMTLEPMNPYERRIIHAALQDYNGVTTYSTGTEPNRRVVVALERGSGRPQRSSSRRSYNSRKKYGE